MTLPYFQKTPLCFRTVILLPHRRVAVIAAHVFCPQFTAFMSVYQHVHPAGSILVTVPMIGISLKFSLSFKIKIVVDAPWI